MKPTFLMTEVAFVGALVATACTESRQASDSPAPSTTPSDTAVPSSPEGSNQPAVVGPASGQAGAPGSSGSGGGGQSGNDPIPSATNGGTSGCGLPEECSANSGRAGDTGGAGDVASPGTAGANGGTNAGQAGGAAGAPAEQPDAGSGGSTALDGSLEIYFVDVEGGQATVLAFPDGRIMVVDAGLPGMRDAGRIADVIEQQLLAGRIDYFLTTHYDADHVGGVAGLAAQFEVVTFLDHGDSEAPSDYIDATMEGTRQIVAAGDELAVGDVRLDFVSSARALISAPLPGAGAANPFCDGATVKEADDENSASIGFVLHFGDFDFVNLADLLWDLEHDLVCPNNLIGEVDLYLTTHHGLERSGAPQLVQALNPLAAIMNNGPRKGGGGETWQTLSLAPGSAEVWQLHLNVQVPEGENALPEQIANLEEGQADAAHFLKVTAQGNGSFVIENPRNGFSKTYPSR